MDSKNMDNVVFYKAEYLHISNSYIIKNKKYTKSVSLRLIAHRGVVNLLYLAWVSFMDVGLCLK